MASSACVRSRDRVTSKSRTPVSHCSPPDGLLNLLKNNCMIVGADMNERAHTHTHTHSTGYNRAAAEH